MTFVCGPSAIAVQHADEAASLRSVHMALQRFRYDLISWRCGLLGVLPAALSGHLLERCSLPAIGWMLLDATGIFRFHSTDQLVGAGAVNGPAVSSSCWTWTKNTWSVNFEVLILFAVKKFQLQSIKLSPFIVATIACQLLWLKSLQSTANQDHARISNHALPYLAMANGYCFLASRHNLTKSQFPPGPATSWQMIARAKADNTCDSTKACPKESPCYTPLHHQVLKQISQR